MHQPMRIHVETNIYYKSKLDRHGNIHMESLKQTAWSAFLFHQFTLIN